MEHTVKDPDEIRQEIEATLAHPTVSVPIFRTKIVPSSKNSIYSAIRRGEIEVVRVGGRIQIVTAPWRRRLGLEARSST
jgi:hypothetical protein